MSRVVPLGDMVAARHALVLDDPDASGEDIVAALDWMDEDSGRSDAVASIHRFLHACDAVEEDRPEVMPVGPSTAPLTRLWASRYLAPLAACLLIGLVTLTVVGLQRLTPGQEIAAAPVRYATAVGEVRTFTFADQARITLGGNSALMTHVSGNTRYFTLTSGQALVGSSRTAIVVDTGAGIVFTHDGDIDIARSVSRTVVTQIRGHAAFRTKAAGQDEVVLSAGMQLIQSADGGLSPVTMVDPSDVTGWQSGKLRFFEEPLDAVVADLNRYSAVPIVIQSPALLEKRVTGLVRTNRIPEWLRGLAMSMEIEVEFTPGGPIILRERPRGQTIAHHDVGGLIKKTGKPIPRSVPPYV